MVEQDARAGKESVALAVVDGNVVAIHLCDTVGAARVKRGALGLRRLPHLAEHLARGGLVEADPGIDEADGVEQARHAERGELRGEHGLGPRGRHEGLRREIVDFLGSAVLEYPDQRELVKEVGLLHDEPRQQVLDALEVVLARPPHHADDGVALLQQKLGEVGAVLARDPRNQCAPAVHAAPLCTRRDSRAQGQTTTEFVERAITSRHSLPGQEKKR
jgi:hypothetical protein